MRFEYLKWENLLCSHSSQSNLWIRGISYLMADDNHPNIESGNMVENKSVCFKHNFLLPKHN